MLSPLTRRIAAYLAIFAMMAIAFVPSAGQVRAAQLGISWVELCAGATIKRVAVDQGGNVVDAPSPGANTLGEHCAYCPLQSQPPALSSVGSTRTFAAVATEPFEALFKTVFLKQLWGATPNSRGPPAI